MLTSVLKWLFAVMNSCHPVAYRDVSASPSIQFSTYAALRIGPSVTCSAVINREYRNGQGKVFYCCCLE